jgi:hypothetical protein
VLLPLLFAAVSAGLLGAPIASPAIATIAAPAVLRTGPIWTGSAPLGLAAAPLPWAGAAVVRSPYIGGPLGPAILG